MGLIATPERKKMIDLAYFMWTEPFNMIVPKPGEEPRLFAFIKPFQSWVIIITCLFLISASVLCPSWSKQDLLYIKGVATHIYHDACCGRLYEPFLETTSAILLKW